MPLHKHLQTAMLLSESYKYDRSLDYHLSAIIVSGGAIISVGYNSSKVNSFVETYANRVKGLRNWCLTSHAELSAINTARNKTDLTGTKIFVARRAKGTGKPVMGRPCAICETALRSHGIKRAYYTVDENHYGVMSIGASGCSDKIFRIDENCAFD